jgi:hypothetical protein
MLGTTDSFEFLFPAIWVNLLQFLVKAAWWVCDKHKHSQMFKQRRPFDELLNGIDHIAGFEIEERRNGVIRNVFESFGYVVTQFFVRYCHRLFQSYLQPTIPQFNSSCHSYV